MKRVNLLHLGRGELMEHIHTVFCSYETRCMSSGLNEIPSLVVFRAHPVREETLWRLRAGQRDYSLYPICSLSL